MEFSLIKKRERKEGRAEAEMEIKIGLAINLYQKGHIYESVLHSNIIIYS
ncbi:MAG: hypothetical protein ACI4V7_01840 [Succinivibrionaceae bacterium]